MQPYVETSIGNLPTYSLMIATGTIVSVAVICMLCLIKKKSIDDAMHLYVLSLLGTAVGAKLLYLVTVCDEITHLFLTRGIKSDWILAYLRGGFVFYGGLIGGMITYYLACRFFRIKPEDYLKILLPAAVLFAGCGRVGCFLTGCCYGRPTESMLGVAFHGSLFAPNDVLLFPIQLYEAGFDLLAAVLLLVFGNRLSAMTELKIYLCAYSVFRFFAEFLRGDHERGFIGNISVSQFISVVILLIILTRILINMERRGAVLHD